MFVIPTKVGIQVNYFRGAILFFEDIYFTWIPFCNGMTK